MLASSSSVSISSAGGRRDSERRRRTRAPIDHLGRDIGHVHRIAEMAPIDHLMWVVPDLRAGIDDLHARTGVRAALGGSHPSMGTANAILGLGTGVYLEVLGPDPDLAEPTGFGATLVRACAAARQLGCAHDRHRCGVREPHRRRVACDRDADDPHPSRRLDAHVVAGGASRSAPRRSLAVRHRLGLVTASLRQRTGAVHAREARRHRLRPTRAATTSRGAPRGGRLGGAWRRRRPRRHSGRHSDQSSCRRAPCARSAIR